MHTVAAAMTVSGPWRGGEKARRGASVILLPRRL